MDEVAKQIIQWGIWGAIMAIVLSFIARSRKKELRDSTGDRLSLPRYVLIVGLLDFVFFFGVALLSNIFPNGTQTVATTLLFLGFCLLGLILVAAYFIEKYSFDIHEIHYTKMTGKKITIAWPSIVRVQYQASMQWFVVTTDRKQKAYFATMLKGMRPFSQLVLESVEHAKIDAEALPVLFRIARGEVV